MSSYFLLNVMYVSSYFNEADKEPGDKKETGDREEKETTTFFWLILVSWPDVLTTIPEPLALCTQIPELFTWNWVPPSFAFPAPLLVSPFPRANPSLHSSTTHSSAQEECSAWWTSGADQDAQGKLLETAMAGKIPQTQVPVNVAQNCT